MQESWIQVKLDRLAANVAALRAALPRQVQPVFVVKADAYGHGLAPVARVAAANGVSWFAVAYLREAMAVRAVAPDAQIVILGAVGEDDVGACVDQRLIPIVVDEAHAGRIAAAAARRGATVHAHLKVDTGMGRFGVPWQDAVPAYERIARLSGLAITGACTHFASVEPRKPSLAPDQMERFSAIADAMRRKSGAPLFLHASSSRALLYHPEWDLDGVRPGIVLYGYGSGERGMRIRTEPILEWRTHVMQVKRVPADFPVGYYSTYTTKAPTTIATIAAGYADGYPRTLSNRGFVLIRGRRRAVVGRVSMNWITVDCGPDSDVQPGDEVVLLGRQGDESVWADDLARLARTIAYEVLTSIRPGIPRRYIPAI